MDRERKDGKHAVGVTRPTYGGKAPSAQPSSTGNQKKTHIRHLSGSTSADSGSGSGPVGASGTGTPSKIRYREQGVDELLQLKLHQAIADADTVPKGSTIVLATGDGNVGQFNEDGFLGPVRTALKRGWKVELYAWEDGLSVYLFSAIVSTYSDCNLSQAGPGGESSAKTVNGGRRDCSVSYPWSSLPPVW